MTSLVLRHAGMALAIAAAFPSFSMAQSLPITQPSLAPIVVTATRSAQPVTEALADTIVISADEITRSGQTSLLDLLQRQRGIEIARNGGPGTSSTVYLRGADNRQSVVLIDGVRVGSATLGGATWSALPLGQIDHIEIVYGPLSSVYGADAIGGVVQIFTRKGEGATRFNASAGYGTEATRSLSAGLSGATPGDHPFSYAVTAARDASDGFSSARPGLSSYNKDRDGYTSDSLSSRFSVALAQGQEVGLHFFGSRLDAQYDSGPSGYDTRSSQKLDTTAVYSRNQLLDNWTSNVQLSRTQDRSGTRTGVTAYSQINTTQTTLNWQNEVRIGPDLLQLLLEDRREEVDSSSTPALAGERTTRSAGASYQLKRGDHLASVSLRNDDSSVFGSNLTGSAGYGYRISSALRANASAGTSFRAPTFNELYFPGFGIAANKPEKGRNIEAGLYYDNGPVQASAVYYRNRISDLLVTTATCPIEPATHPFGCAYNVNKALLTGVSLAASTRRANVTLRGTLDLQDPRDETTGKSLTRRARQHGTVGIDYRAGAITTGAEIIFAGRRFDDAANRNRLGGYGLLNLLASVDLASGWTLFGRWNNATGKDYELARNYATAGANVFVGMRYAMK